MNWYLLIKWLHVITSTVLLGTGAGIAFFFMRARRSADTRIIASVGRDVVLADAVFTATAVIVQAASGIALALMAGFPLSAPWLVVSIALFILVGCCWLPVLWLQIRMRDMAASAASAATPLPPTFKRYYGLWVALGWPAFIGVLGIFYLMVAKPMF